MFLFIVESLPFFLNNSFPSWFLFLTFVYIPPSILVCSLAVGFPTTTSIVNKHHFLQNQSCHCRVFHPHHHEPSAWTISQWGRGKPHGSISHLNILNSINPDWKYLHKFMLQICRQEVFLIIITTHGLFVPFLKVLIVTKGLDYLY